MMQTQDSQEISVRKEKNVQNKIVNIGMTFANI